MDVTVIHCLVSYLEFGVHDLCKAGKGISVNQIVYLSMRFVQNTTRRNTPFLRFGGLFLIETTSEADIRTCQSNRR